MNEKHRNSKKVVVFGISVVLLTTCGLVWYHKTRPYHFAVIKPGQLYRSGWMSSNDQEKIIKKYNIRTIVNLCLPNEHTYLKNHIDEEQICRKDGVKLINLPLQGNTPPSKDQVSEWLNLLSKDENLPILVHCAQGGIRTGVMVAIYEMEFFGKGNKETLEGLQTFGHELNVPKRKKICDFILDYNPSKKAS